MKQTTITSKPPPEVSNFESNLEENRTSGIHENTSNMDSNVNIGVSMLEPTYTSVPHVSLSFDEDFIIGEEPKPLEDFSIPNFRFRVDSDDEENLSSPMTRGEFRELKNKMDQILKHTSTFSTTNWENMVISHQETIKMLTKDNANTFESQQNLANDSTKKIVECNEKVVSKIKEMSFEMKNFMYEFQISSDKNFTKVNKVIEGFCLSLQTKNEALSSLHFGLQHDNADHYTSIANSILRMKTDLAYENKIMDALVESTQKVKVLKEQLKNATIKLGK